MQSKLPERAEFLFGGEQPGRRTGRVLYHDGRGGSAVKRERPASVDHVVTVAELTDISRQKSVEVGAPVCIVRDGLDGCGG